MTEVGYAVLNCKSLERLRNLICGEAELAASESILHSGTSEIYVILR
jgi:hypothetical protein